VLNISIYPEPCYVFGVNVGLSVVIAWCVMALVLTGLLLLYFLVVRRMKPVPKGGQNLVELVIDGMHRWSEGKVGHAAADFVGPVAMSLMVYVFFCSIVEMFGLPPATKDINCTFAVGLCSFITLNVSGLKFRGGLRGRIRGLSTPSPIVLPIRMLTDLISPCSMAIRLFANIMVAGIVMELIYSLVPVVLPAAVAAYFSVFDAGIQTFIIGLLTLVYASEAIE
jgi:F-type H+-transporting ATPase subunit a